MTINQYQFDNICRQMEKEFGKIRKGEENHYLPFLYAIEYNLLKTHRQYPASNSRRLLEAIPLVLFQLKSNMTGEEYELERFQSEDNERLVHAMLMAFDPLTNVEIAAAFRKNGILVLDDQVMLKDIYAVSVMCILRIKESVELFVQQLGSDGYFDFLEGNIGTEISQDEEFNFTVMLPEDIVLVEKEPEEGIVSGEQEPERDTVQGKEKRSLFSRFFKRR